MSSLQGRTALVTGGAKRIGGAICKKLSQEGVNIILHYNNSHSEAASLAGELGARLVCAELSNPHEAEAFIQRTYDDFGGFDILINNASVFESDTLFDMTRESFFQNVSINALSPLFMARRFGKLAESGDIVNMLDYRTCSYDFKHVSYHASKYLAELFTRELAHELAPNIKVNGIAPGLVLPPGDEDFDYCRKLASRTLLNKCATPEDIANGVAYLLSADYITGEIIRIDGGRHIKEGRNG